jgi:hypothetical protein
MYGKKQWRGREVEGRYSDMMTFFVRELGDGLEVETLLEYPHYYFTVEYMEKMLGVTISDMIKGVANTNKEYITTIRQILDETNAAVTIEANSKIISHIPPDLFNRCHVIYRIQDEAVQKLKQTDTLSIDAGWYKCHMIAKMHMQETTPGSYLYDEEI